MAKVGRHANAKDSGEVKTEKKPGGAHAVSRRDRKAAASSLSHAKPAKSRTRTVSLKNIVKALLLLFVCFVMISPLKSCILTDDDYIGVSEAQRIALDDSGILSDKANDIRIDLVKVDGEMYYKVQFTGTVTDYRYIIDASSGDITARAFYHIEGEG